MRAQQNTTAHLAWPTSPAVPLVSVLAVFALCISPNIALAQHPGGGQPHNAPHSAPAPQVHSAPPPQNHPAPAYQPPRPAQPYPELRAPSNPPGNASHFVEPGPKTSYANVHSGQQQHLPEWLNNHQNLTPKQQEDALRREPGFHDLPADQQQRLVNRLHSLDEKTPEQRQRILARNEAFEHLSPERQQDVRGASQALSQMSPDRQQAVRHAFHDLRQMPPQQRQQMLNSGSYASQFSPQERTVLGNLLSIEPYQQHPGGVAQPYFGR